MLHARWTEHSLQARFPLGTSKGTLDKRTVWYLIAWNDEWPERIGIGEAAPFPGHSLEFPADVRTKLLELCQRTTDWQQRLQGDLIQVPSVRAAVEQCLRDLDVGGTKELFPSDFTLGQRGIPINGLVWMGDKRTMRARIRAIIADGYRVVKLKIGALDWAEEEALLREVRSEFNANDLELRVDANGAFDAAEVMPVLHRLADLGVQSIEQPIAPGRYELMAEVVAASPVPIALDEDLIGLHHTDARTALLDTVRPGHIVIKPSLVGGWQATREWIGLAGERGIGWWITSALESSIGLNAIAQFTATLPIDRAQGLGTGSVYLNNIPSPLEVENGALFHRPERGWDLSLFRP
ncbi:MAG: o-succinylbenzoate synthase [Flavobacteriales bacterium]